MRWKEKAPCCAGMWIIFPGILASGRKRYGNFLQKEAEAEEVLGRDLTRVDNAVILGSAGTIMETFLHSQNVYGIETMGGAAEYIHVVPQTYLGSTGALYLLEQLINGNRMLKAWK